ncbi:hypothetical protein BZG21_39775, partial [Escherichia coli]|nr:hypothetical protein [Escherichia coli]
MKPFHFMEKRLVKKVLGLFLVIVMLASIGVMPASKVQAAGTTVTSMDYFSPADGPVISKSGVGKASYGFVMPKFNGGSATWNDVYNDVGVNVKVGSSWVDIDQAGGYIYNQNWG